MKTRQIFLKIFILFLIITILPITSLKSIADEENKNLQLQYNRHSDEEGEEHNNGYAFNTNSDKSTHHPIFKIVGIKNDEATYNYYCLNALYGRTWMGDSYLEDGDGEINANESVEYNKKYDLQNEDDIAELKADLETAYGKLVNSPYFKQILWILKNSYIMTANKEENEVRKNELLEAAGIKYSDIEENVYGPGGMQPQIEHAYKYVVPEGYEDYLSETQNVGNVIGDATNARGGWYYHEKDTSEFKSVILPDEMIEVAQQAAIWYYANYLGGTEEEKNEEYNVRTQGLQLLCSGGKEAVFPNWEPLIDLYEVETDSAEYKVKKGRWYQDQATILCWYLIDAAQKYADAMPLPEGIPLKITEPQNGELEGKVKKTINDGTTHECYVLGPIKIEKTSEAPYTIYKLLDTIKVNNENCADYYVLEQENQSEATSGNLSSYLNKETIKQNGFYLAIPTNYVTETEEIEVEFDGTCRNNSTILWKDELGVEQPVAEVGPNDDPFKLLLNTKKIENVDLALTKFITAISTDETIEDGEYITADKHIGSKENPYLRATAVDTTPLINWTINSETHDAIYTRDKTPLLVPQEAYVLYNIRVYNEGEVDVYAGEIEDQLPDNLEYVDCDFNKNYRWQLQTDGKTIRTDYLSHNVNSTDNLLKAFDKDADDGKGSKLDYRDVQVLCKVKESAPSNTKLINTAEISKYEDEKGNEFEKDIDSTEHNRTDKNQEKRQEDDDDWEVVYINTEKIVDLALTKFITAISTDETIEDGEYITADKHIGSKENPYLRATAVDTTPLINWTINSETHDAIYTRDKTPLLVPQEAYVLYNIRVYNEGEVDVYAGEIEDQLPDNLEYVDCDFNKNYRWQLQTDGKTIRTDYLSHNVNSTDNLLKAFDKDADDGKGSKLDYRDVQVLCKVKESAPSNTKLINTAEISKYEDEKGNEFEKDIDSTEHNRTDKNQEKRQEDDDDWEVVLVQVFDLSLLKWVSAVYVTEDGVTTTTQTGNTGNDQTDIIPKVEINKKKLQDTVVRFGYTIQITNEGDIAGYAKEITDYVPEGLKFYAEDNTGWTDEGNNVISTKLLENVLLQPGESAQVTVILRWINGEDNLNMKTNIAEISEDENEYGVPDKDSTPDNKKDGEDDIDDASVLLAISTGIITMVGNMLPTILGICGFLVILALWLMLIKKYIL